MCFDYRLFTFLDFSDPGGEYMHTSTTVPFFCSVILAVRTCLGTSTTVYFLSLMILAVSAYIHTSTTVYSLRSISDLSTPLYYYLSLILAVSAYLTLLLPYTVLALYRHAQRHRRN